MQTKSGCGQQLGVASCCTDI